MFKRADGIVDREMSIACGRCIGCKLERTRSWMVRILHESSLVEASCFLTLTFNDLFLPKDLGLDVSFFQLFIKRLRESVSPLRFRYFMCGEYGDRDLRPHFHAVLFGYDFPDKTYWKASKSKFGRSSKLFVSDKLNAAWKYGFATIGEVTPESAAYVARYSLKKITGPPAEEHYGGRKPEFITMSLGIGKKWFDLFKSDVFGESKDSVVIKGRSYRTPTYYFKLLEKSDPKLYKILQSRRRASFPLRYSDEWSKDGSTQRLEEREAVQLAEYGLYRRDVR